MKKKLDLKVIIPILMGFFIMSFVDLVGIGVDRATSDFNLSDSLAQLIPSAAFLWFFILSVPISTLQSTLGKKKMLNIGIIITAIGLIIPYFLYTFPMVILGFTLLGIGNTIIQVSANPLLVSCVPSNRTSSFLSFSQFVKALGSMIGAPLAGFLASQYGDWRLIMVIFGVASILAAVWLGSVDIEEEKTAKGSSPTIASSFKLLNNGFILMMVFNIFLVVGIDVGINSTSGQFLMNKLHLDSAIAESGRSFYFFGKMIGTFAGAILLAKFASRKLFILSAILELVAILVLLMVGGATAALATIFIIGLGVANIFPLVYSIAVERHPDKSNQLAGLMMMAVSGGAVLPLLSGIASENFGVSASVVVLMSAAIFILITSIIVLKQKAPESNQI